MRRTLRAMAVLLPLLVLVAASQLAAQTPAPTASQFYLQYRTAFDKAQKIEDLLPYLAAKNRAEIEATPAGDRSKMFQLFKMMATLTEVKIIKETRNGDGATLTVEGLDSDKAKTTGTIEVVKENGAWKVGKESWKS